MLAWCRIYASWKTALISLVTHICVANPSISLIGPGGGGGGGETYKTVSGHTYETTWLFKSPYTLIGEETKNAFQCDTLSDTFSKWSIEQPMQRIDCPQSALIHRNSPHCVLEATPLDTAYLFGITINLCSISSNAMNGSSYNCATHMSLSKLQQWRETTFIITDIYFIS